MPSQTAASDQTERGSLVDRMPRWVLLVLLCLVLTVRGRAMLSMVSSLENDPDSYLQVAAYLYDDHTFGLWQSEFRLMMPTASRPPLYPLLLSPFEGVRQRLGSHIHIYGLLHVVLGVATVLGVWRLGQLWGLGASGSLVAAGLMTLDPILINQSVQIMTETLAALLAVLALLAITRSARECSLRRALLCGALLGLCVLCRPTFLVWLLGVAIVFPLACDGRRRLLRTAALAVAAAAVLAPWAIRNQIVFGWPVIITSHGGRTLLLANNPEFYEYLRAAPWGSTWDAKEFNREWKLQQDLIETPIGLAVDELEDDRRSYALAWQNIKREPAMFAYACLVRIGRLWAILPHPTSPDESASHRGLRYAVAIWYLGELVLAATGLWFLGRRLTRPPWLWGLLLLISFTAVHAFYWTDLRMRAPLESVVVLLAAQGVVVLASRRSAIRPLVVET
jgi:4-amino-4-deoxy-L-arabinose transferase-like glycosyltransferase